MRPIVTFAWKLWKMRTKKEIKSKKTNCLKLNNYHQRIWLACIGVIFNHVTLYRTNHFCIGWNIHSRVGFYIRHVNHLREYDWKTYSKRKYNGHHEEHHHHNNISLLNWNFDFVWNFDELNKKNLVEISINYLYFYQTAVSWLCFKAERNYYY